MKLSALQQSYVNRRNNSFRGSPPLEASLDGGIKSPAAIFWLVLHCLCCLISLVLGFRFSRLIFFLLFSTSTTSNLYSTLPFRTATELSDSLTVQTTPPNPQSPANRTVVSSSSRVVVGRHGILIRPWPHPNAVEVMKAHRIIELVQSEQRVQYGVKNPRTVIALTPTYVRTFQTLHLTGVMHSLMNVPYNLIWIVVEAGGTTNETASLLAKSGIRTIHIGFNQKMPISWEGRHRMEALMRLRALSANYIGDRAIVLPRKLEWAGFVLNSRLLWKEAEDKPMWVKDLDTFTGNGDNFESPLALLKDPSVVEPLGSCGRKVLLWWLRVEARADSQFPARWIIDPPLEVTVPAKRTPWPDAPPELPSNVKTIGMEENNEKHATKTRTHRSKHTSRSKRKREARAVDTQVLPRRFGEK
ncbi:hypothetical protein ACSBR2_009905 [Camellia fascicularis]